MSLLRYLLTGLVIGAAMPAAADEVSRGLPDTASSRERLFKRSSDLSLGRLSDASRTLDLIADADWRDALRDAGMEISQTQEDGLRIRMDAPELAIPGKEHAALQAAGLPVVLDDVQLDALVTRREGGPADTNAVRAITGIDLTRIRLGLGGIVLSGSGKAEADAGGLMQGDIELEVEQWRAALALPAFAGINAGGQLEAALEAFASGDTLNVTLRIVDGRVKLGPLELARLPLPGLDGPGS